MMANVVADRGTRVARLVGELDASCRATVMHACCEGSETKVRVDLSELTFMDCGGYRGLTEARLALEAIDRPLTFGNAVGEPARLLNLLLAASPADHGGA